MQFSHLKMCFHLLAINRLPVTPLSPNVGRFFYGAKYKASVKRSSYQASLVNKCGQISRTKSQASPSPSTVNTENGTDIWQWYEQELEFLGVELDGSLKSEDTYTYEDKKERDRRKKIGLANKGKVPWNKGKKHTSETLELISQRTKEAMMDPKVRKKMAECPRAHSEQTKERIGTSLKSLWAEKLRLKRSRAKFLSIWENNIAEAAKRGGCDLQELDWDSYDEIKEEMAKEMAKLEAAQREAEKMVRLARKREKQEQRDTTRGEIKRKTQRKSKVEKEELTVAVGLKLKERLTKIHKRRISTNGQVSLQDHRTWERLDLTLIKTENTRKQLSLADQIQAAKTKREELEDKSAE